MCVRIRIVVSPLELVGRFSNVTYRDDEGDVDLAGLALLLFAVDDVHVGDGEVIQAVLVMVPHHPAVVHRAVPAVHRGQI